MSAQSIGLTIIQAEVLVTNTKAIDAYMTPMAHADSACGQPSAVRLP